jgi:hypothetical protein
MDINKHGEYVSLWKENASIQSTTLTSESRDASVAIATS